MTTTTKRKQLRTVYFGLELEHEFHPTECPEYAEMVRGVSAYHSTSGECKVGRFWKAERDGSLSAEAPGSRCVELKSATKLGVRHVREALREFRSFFPSDCELIDVLNFNESTGAHVHFSTSDDPRMHSRIMQQHESTLHRIVSPKVERLLGKDRAREWEKSYYRDYAMKPSRSTIYERYVSLNTSTGLRTVEWRSFHLRHIRTWAEFFGMMEAAITSITEAVNEWRRDGFSVTLTGNATFYSEIPMTSTRRLGSLFGTTDLIRGV